jgi:hypothetical protein
VIVSDYDRKVVSWDHVKRVKIKGKYLHLETPEFRLLGTFILDQSRCCIFGAIHLSFFVIVMVVARSARRNLEQKSDSSKGSVEHDK